MAVGDEVFFVDCEHVDKTKVTRNLGLVTDVFEDRKIREPNLFYKIKVTKSSGHSQRELKSCKIRSYVFLRKSPHRKKWESEALREEKLEEQTERLLAADGIFIDKETGEVTYI